MVGRMNWAVIAGCPTWLVMRQVFLGRFFSRDSAKNQTLAEIARSLVDDSPHRSKLAGTVQMRNGFPEGIEHLGLGIILWTTLGIEQARINLQPVKRRGVDRCRPCLRHQRAVRLARSVLLVPDGSVELCVFSILNVFVPLGDSFLQDGGIHSFYLARQLGDSVSIQNPAFVDLDAVVFTP